MNDDWRLRIELGEESHAQMLTAALSEAQELAHDLRGAFHDRVIVSRDGPVVFCYTATREQAQAAQRLIDSLAEKHGWTLRSQLTHWHPVAEAWEDPDEPLPQADADAAAEHARLIEQERADTDRLGFAEWEVRVQRASHHDAAALSAALRQEGMPHVHRWHYLLVGAADEDSARELAARIEREAPPGTSASVEPAARAAYALGGRQTSPFAVFGGIGI
ncbi:MAG TPA: hypothetical protein VKU89_02980 [Solirubrobacteraceae bacterium]|nr:hypothetical protein [Solirubrobacteraceae bacterium]